MEMRFATPLLVLGLAACAAQPQPAMTRPPTPKSASSVAPMPSAAQTGSGHWDVEAVRCSDLLDASDADRAAAAMFYYGYLAAKAGIRVIDVTRIDGNIAKVMQQCEAAPNLTVTQAFAAALRPQP